MGTPDWPLPHIASAYLDLYAQTVEGNGSARARLQLAEDAGTGPTAREQAHLSAARQWWAQDLPRALATLQHWLDDHPRDLLALRIAQDLAFFTGDSDALLEVPADALEAWADSESERGIVAGMAAFGLEEQGRCLLYTSDAADE